MHSELLYQLSLTLIPNIGPVQAKILLQHCEPEEIFHAKKTWLEKMEGIGPIRAESIKKFKDFAKAEAEIKFIERQGIKPIFLTDKDYPKRLLHWKKSCNPPAWPCPPRRKPASGRITNRAQIRSSNRGASE